MRDIEDQHPVSSATGKFVHIRNAVFTCLSIRAKIPCVQMKWKNPRRRSYSLIFAALQAPMLVCLPTHHRLCGGLLCKESKETSVVDVETWRVIDTHGSHCQDADCHARVWALWRTTESYAFCVLLWSESGAVGNIQIACFVILWLLCYRERWDNPHPILG